MKVEDQKAWIEKQEGFKSWTLEEAREAFNKANNPNGEVGKGMRESALNWAQTGNKPVKQVRKVGRVVSVKKFSVDKAFDELKAEFIERIDQLRSEVERHSSRSQLLSLPFNELMAQAMAYQSAPQVEARMAVEALDMMPSSEK